MELERWQEADEDFKKVIKLQPRHPKAIAQIAKLNQHISSELHSCPAPACCILAVNPSGVYRSCAELNSEQSNMAALQPPGAGRVRQKQPTPVDVQPPVSINTVCVGILVVEVALTQ